MQIFDAQNLLSPDLVDHNLQQEILSVVQECFGSKTLITSIHVLTDSSRRNQVMRLKLEGSTLKAPSSIILKRPIFKESFENQSETLGRFARDWAGLEFLSSLNCEVVPKFYGGNQKYQFVLFEDLGETHLSLVDALMGHDREEAIQSLTRYMESLGQFHSCSYGHLSFHEELLRKLNPVVSYWQSYYDQRLNQIKASLEKIGVSYNENLIREIEQIWKTCLSPGPFTVLLHGDICPDNVFDHPQQQKIDIIDFEWSYVGNALLDATYLRMSMPTCWCVKALPQNIIEPLELVYRRQLMAKIPAAADDQLYYQSYTAACGYWILNQLKHLDGILENDIDPLNYLYPLPHPKWQKEDKRRRPSALLRFEAFLNISKVDDQWPYLKTMTEQILIELKKKWAGIKPLEVYPAFQEIEVK